MLIGHTVTCKTCQASTIVLDGQNVHDALDCKCCPSSTHTHADAKGRTKKPCRNVVIGANAVVVPTVGG